MYIFFTTLALVFIVPVVICLTLFLFLQKFTQIGGYLASAE